MSYEVPPGFLIVFGQPNTLTYTNHRGETSQRTIRPDLLRHGVSPWHKEPQWLIECWDLEKQEHRTFALSGIKVGG